MGVLDEIPGKTAVLACFTALLFSACASTPSTRALLSLPYQQFDQIPGAGWRGLADQGRFLDAARVIERYLTEHPSLPPDQQAILHFHAAQLHAFAQGIPSALQHLNQARIEKEPVDSPVRWNDYVDATAAFLSSDRAQLAAARERIASGPALNGEIPNLNIVDALIARVGEPYAIAYKAGQ